MIRTDIAQRTRFVERKLLNIKILADLLLHETWSSKSTKSLCHTQLRSTAMEAETGRADTQTLERLDFGSNKRDMRACRPIHKPWKG